ncbi:MAG: DUF1631 domain-containing protein [bacterium]
MSQVKVVELNVEGNQKTSLPPIVHTIRQQSKKQLNELLQNLFNNTDDALFELADRSQSDQHQEMYFDSMRMIRLHRKTLASNFIRGLNDSYQEAFSPSASGATSADDEIDAEDYALLDQDELEMTVAVSGIVSKVTSQYSIAVMQLTKRLDYLAKHQTITERNNPLGPHALSSLFASALDTLEVDIKIRIILMKLFERFVMERLGPVYESANRALIDADVLPDLKNKAPKRAGPAGRSSAGHQPSNTRGTHHGTGFNSMEGSAGSIAFDTVQSLLSGTSYASAGQAGQGQQPAAGTGSGTISGLSSGTPMISLPRLDSGELIQVLSRLQSAAQVDPIDIEQVPELRDVRSLVLAQPDTAKKSLGQADDDAVNFVGMLFDYILNDRNLAIPMKALIGRLQIPIIKLAIIDKTFFEKTAHPARALLNELSSAGIGWSNAAELKRDALYNKIESVVLRVLNEFSDNPDVFSELLTDLRHYVSKDTRRSVLVEQRVKESEVGKAKTTAAKLKVQNLVNQKACGLRLPSEAGKFISETWTRVLTLRIIKLGETSPAWNAGVKTLDDLLWVLQPLSDLEEVENRDQLTQSLITEIYAGMTEVGCPDEETEAFQSWLTEHLDALSANDRAYLEEDERPELDVNEALMEEIILASPPTVIDERTFPEAVMEQLKLITEGTWIEIFTEDERTLRCKLATITQPGNNYIFVNRRGMKVLEKNRGELAEMLEHKQLKRIDESQVFDRALQSVIGNLRQLQRERSQ